MEGGKSEREKDNEERKLKKRKMDDRDAGETKAK